jgi:hypothetical protein
MSLLLEVIKILTHDSMISIKPNITRTVIFILDRILCYSKIITALEKIVDSSLLA